MSSTIHFYFDFTSPYGYLAAMRIDQLAAKYAQQVEWHPILLGVIFKTTGTLPLVDVPLKGTYSLHDLKRSARFHAIPFQQPEHFPISTQNTARAMLWIANKLGEDSAIKFAKAAYQAYFVDGINIGEIEHVVQIANRLGFDGDTLANEISSPEIKAQLKAEVDAAQEQGVFGAPFVIIDGEPFWGFDRFDQIEALLKNGQI
ncbi:2-hydroxychromene-2-carboxylate isomerase [Solimicrobium silvestre]|uniref:2-hydroxychromene-2-carboxylate isomerase n=1 Tax=Solimicrobium silvestre TaxID=2099400 RepID=A0A2S9H058_9BURK|nr:2-hydroxychromene-2-carboxylate isomerase [Solimicrobium silvestre]PRC93338.1 2-hydroxychromene-2-carboxylate isomerase [Solimicrobium silvestre]